MPDPRFDALDEARLMYWKFHWGIPPKRSFRAQGPRGIPPVTSQLARLEAFEMESGDEVKPTRAVHLATDPKGADLFLVSRNPMRLQARGGRIRAVRYRTRKDAGGQRFRHEFSPPRPTLGKDRDGFPVIRRSGSSYRINWRGIVG